MVGPGVLVAKMTQVQCGFSKVCNALDTPAGDLIASPPQIAPDERAGGFSSFFAVLVRLGRQALGDDDGRQLNRGDRLP